MPVIKYKRAIERVLGKPVFTPVDMQHEGVPGKYSKKLLFMLARSGRIRRIERGKYTCLDDPVAVAAHITRPCYLSLWTAMSIRNLTAQIPFSVEVITSRKRFRRKLDFAGTAIIFHTVNPRMMFGYENIIWKENIRVPVAKTEKIAIDAVHIGGMPKDEILQVIRASDKRLLIKYAKLTGNGKIREKIAEMIKCLHKKK